MTQPDPPQGTPEDEVPPPGEVQSPQAIAMDEAMAQAESSLTPVIAALIAAEVARQSIPTLDEFPGPGPYRTSRWAAKAVHMILRNTLVGLEKIIRGAVELLLIPLGLLGWRVMTIHSDTSPRAPYTDDVRDAVSLAVDEAVHKVAESVEFVLTKDELNDDDIYNLYGVPGGKFNPNHTGDDEPHVDPRSATQRAIDNLARQMSRWLTRETVFSMQETVARSMGFTHKRWITMHDHKVRDFHRILHGRAVPVGEKFSTPVGDLRYPGDTSAPIGLWINCRCVIEWIAR